MLVRPKVDSTIGCSGLLLNLQSSSSVRFWKAHAPPAGTSLGWSLEHES